jgi:hypothetical protein
VSLGRIEAGNFLREHLTWRFFSEISKIDALIFQSAKFIEKILGCA